MIIKVALVLLYLIIGLWLFVIAVSYLGGVKAIPAYRNKPVFILAMMLTVTFWPIFVIQSLIQKGGDEN